jgi:hypothetical protein
MVLRGSCCGFGAVTEWFGMVLYGFALDLVWVWFWYVAVWYAYDCGLVAVCF